MMAAQNEARVAKARSMMMAPQRPLMYHLAAVDCSIVIGTQQVSGYMMTWEEQREAKMATTNRLARSLSLLLLQASGFVAGTPALQRELLPG